MSFGTVTAARSSDATEGHPGVTPQAATNFGMEWVTLPPRSRRSIPRNRYLPAVLWLFGLQRGLVPVFGRRALLLLGRRCLSL